MEALVFARSRDRCGTICDDMVRCMVKVSTGSRSKPKSSVKEREVGGGRRKALYLRVFCWMRGCPEQGKREKPTLSPSVLGHRGTFPTFRNACRSANVRYTTGDARPGRPGPSLRIPPSHKPPPSYRTPPRGRAACRTWESTQPTFWTPRWPARQPQGITPQAVSTA